MKKTIIASLLAVATFSVFAGEFAEITVNPSIRNKATDKVIADAASVTLGTTALQFVTIDGKVATERTRIVGTVATSGQIRGTFTAPITKDIDVWGRGGVGKLYTAGNDYTFYTYAAGANLNVYDKTFLFADVERNQAFKAGNPHFVTYELGMGYNFTKKDGVKVSYLRSLGDINTGGLQVAYDRKF